MGITILPFCLLTGSRFQNPAGSSRNIGLDEHAISRILSAKAGNSPIKPLAIICRAGAIVWVVASADDFVRITGRRPLAKGASALSARR